MSAKVFAAWDWGFDVEPVFFDEQGKRVEPDPPPRPVIVGINVPAPGETWQDLNQWRRRYGLAPVEEGDAQ